MTVVPPRDAGTVRDLVAASGMELRRWNRRLTVWGRWREAGRFAMVACSIAFVSTAVLWNRLNEVMAESGSSALRILVPIASAMLLLTLVAYVGRVALETWSRNVADHLKLLGYSDADSRRICTFLSELDVTARTTFTSLPPRDEMTMTPVWDETLPESERLWRSLESIAERLTGRTYWAWLRELASRRRIDVGRREVLWTGTTPEVDRITRIASGKFTPWTEPGRGESLRELEHRANVTSMELGGRGIRFGYEYMRSVQGTILGVERHRLWLELTCLCVCGFVLALMLTADLFSSGYHLKWIEIVLVLALTSPLLIVLFDIAMNMATKNNFRNVLAGLGYDPSIAPKVHSYIQEYLSATDRFDIVVPRRSALVSYPGFDPNASEADQLIRFLDRQQDVAVDRDLEGWHNKLSAWNATRDEKMRRRFNLPAPAPPAEDPNLGNSGGWK